MNQVLNKLKKKVQKITHFFVRERQSKPIDKIISKVLPPVSRLYKFSRLNKVIYFLSLVAVYPLKKIFFPVKWTAKKVNKVVIYCKNKILNFARFIKQTVNLSYYQKLPELSNHNRAVYLTLLHNNIRATKIVCLTVLTITLAVPVIYGLKYTLNIKNKITSSDVVEIEINLPIFKDNYDLERIDNIADEEPKLVILNINSPGGSASFSYDMYRKLLSLAKKTRVIVITNGLIASGSYMIAMSAERIFASEMSIIGSIGVISNYYEVTELANKVGIKFENVKTSQYKASPNEYEKTNPDVRKYQIGLLNDVMKIFKDIVSQRRKIEQRNVSEVFSGKVFLAENALKLGLIDQIATRDELLDILVAKGFMKTNKDKIKYMSIEKSKKDDSPYGINGLFKSLGLFSNLFKKEGNTQDKQYEVLAM